MDARDERADLRRRVVGCGFTAAMAAAPFAALVYGRTVALAVLTLTLAATLWLLRNAAPDAPAEHRRRLTLMTAVIALLTLASAAVLLRRLVF